MKRTALKGPDDRKNGNGAAIRRSAQASYLRAQQSALYELSVHEAFDRADPAEIFPIITETCAHALNVARVSVWQYTDDRVLMRCVDLFELGSRRHSSGIELALADYPNYFQALESGIAVAANDARRNHATKEFAENYLVPLGIGAMLDATIRRGGQVIGVVCFEHIGSPRRWTDDERSFAVTVATLVSNFLEVGEHRRAREALTESNELLGSIFDNTSVMIAYLDADFNFIHVNRAYAADDGREPEYYVGKNHFTLFPDSENEEIFRRVLATAEPYMTRAKRFVFTDQPERGVTYWDITLTPVRRDGRITGLVLLLYEVTEFIEAQERMQYLAYYDVLTDLPNRTLFSDRLGHALARASRSGHSLAVVFLDLDRFKIINDSLGHHTGDVLLKAFAARLRTCVRESDTVAHISGDEFAVALEEIASVEDAGKVARKILDQLAAPLVCEGREFYVTSSIGISVCPADGKDATTLMKYADAAMYKAKEAGGNTYRFYAAEMGQRTAERLTFEQSLRHALEREEFTLHFQPIVSLASGRVTAVEALLRWRHPDLGLVSPIRFIPLLEETGMIVPVGEWVLRQACRQARQWQTGGHPVRIAVNLSPRQFAAPGLVDHLVGALADSELPAELVELEITEGMLMQQSPLIHDTFFCVRDLGCRFSIDDFGTGYSSLSYLRRFPVSTLKIDRSFVADIMTDNDDAAIVRTIIAMAHNLKMEIVAEGVETQEQFDFLRANGCELAQGYLLARPMPAEDIPELLKTMNRD